MKCPSCTASLHQAGRTFKCEHCDGAWVKDEVVVPLLEQSASALVELPWRPNAEDHVRACPECNESMQTVKLGTVALDRCEPHGVWFDAKELAALLGQAKSFRVGSHEEVHVGLLERFAGLFK
jgi:Zn-finger nucleic acid-binding protein